MEGTRYIPGPLRTYLYTVYKYSTFTMAAWQENSAHKLRLCQFLLAVGLTALASSGWARPAPWYWWASQASNHRVCAQSAPGTGWFRESTAFTDSACSRRVKPF